jgi:alkylation response protein AidB-like acyl-CoA dehydrogenase
MPQAVFDDPEGVLAMLRDSVATVSERRPGAASLRKKRAAAADIDRELWSAMAEAGWTSLLLPEELGGAGLGLREQAVLSESLGRALFSEAVSTNAVFIATVLRNAPDSPVRERLARQLAGGGATVVPVVRNKRIGESDIRATATSGGYSLYGEGHYVEQAATARDFLVLAETESGAAFFAIPASSQGIDVETRAGVDGTALARVSFRECVISTESIVATGTSAADLLEGPITYARVALAAELAGLASRAVELTIEYTKTRVQFGKPIASFQAIQHRLVEMWSDAEFACASVVNAVEKLASTDRRAGQLAVMAAKARAGDAAVSICRRSVHLHGAMGFTDECDIGLYLKRAVNLAATLGQPEDMRIEFIKLERAA